MKCRLRFHNRFPFFVVSFRTPETNLVYRVSKSRRVVETRFLSTSSTSVRFHPFADSVRDSKPVDSTSPISLLLCRDGEDPGKDRLELGATDPAAAALAASARVRVPA